MKFAELWYMAVFPTLVTPFAPLALPSRQCSSSIVSGTALGISSWGIRDDSDGDDADVAQSPNPEENVQAYLNPPEPVETRENIDGTVLVSGLVDSKQRTDQFLFDLLNDEESAFEFGKIVAFVDNVSFAKKRLLSRSARYTGLLDKLDFAEASNPGSLPKAEDLKDVRSWVACLDGGNLSSKVDEVASIAKEAPSLRNLAVLLSDAGNLDLARATESVKLLQGLDISYTVVAVGKLEDHAEGKYPYQVHDFSDRVGDLAPESVFSRDEAMRIITQCLQLKCSMNRALTVSEVYDSNATEARLIRGLREGGYSRPQEVDHMLHDGAKKYEDAISDFHRKHPHFGKGYTEAWWEAEEFQKSARENARVEEEEKQKVVDARTARIEGVAREWVKREYYRLSVAGNMPQGMTEESFAETVWDRALREGEMRYRRLHGEDVNDEKDYDEVKEERRRRNDVLLERAKEDLKALLGEDLGIEPDDSSEEDTDPGDEDDEEDTPPQ